MFEVATEADLSRTSQQPGRQHAGEVTKKKKPNQNVEGPPIFHKTFNDDFSLRGNWNERDFDEDNEYYFDQTPFRQRPSANSSQSASTGSSRRVQENGTVHSERVSDSDLRKDFYGEAIRRAKLIREIENERVEQVRRSERYGSLPAKQETMNDWRREMNWNQPNKQLDGSYKAWKSTGCKTKCIYCEVRGTECHGATDGISDGCVTCRRMNQRCRFMTELEADSQYRYPAVATRNRTNEQPEILSEVQRYPQVYESRRLEFPWSARSTRPEEPPRLQEIQFPRRTSESLEQSDEGFGSPNEELNDMSPDHELYDDSSLNHSHKTANNSNGLPPRTSTRISTPLGLVVSDQGGLSNQTNEEISLKTQYADVLKISTNFEDAALPGAPFDASRKEAPIELSEATLSRQPPQESMQLEGLSPMRQNIKSCLARNSPSPKPTPRSSLPLADRLKRLLEASSESRREQKQAQHVERDSESSHSSNNPSDKFIDTGNGLLRSERVPPPSRFWGVGNESSWYWGEVDSNGLQFWRHWTHDLPHRERDP